MERPLIRLIELGSRVAIDDSADYLEQAASFFPEVEKDRVRITGYH